MDKHAGQSFEGCGVKVRFKITAALLETIRADLRRPHPFAYERVGFISAKLARSAEAVLVLAQTYRPVADEDYLPDVSVGAMMGPEAIRKAMEWALVESVGIFHVHTHGGGGMPGFSDVDMRESAKFVPDFLKAAPQNIHGAIVLSDNAAAGRVWFARDRRPQRVAGFVEVGTPLRKWGMM
jgi:hypothetical protein